MKMKKIFLVALFILIGQFVFAQLSGNALDFDGTNDFVDLGTSSLLKPTSALTAETWVYVDNWSSVDDSRFICNTESGGYSIEVQDDMTRGLVRLNGKYEKTYFDQSTLAKGWHHFVLTCDGRYTKLYVDGTLVDSADAGAVYPIHYEYNNSTLLGAEATEISTTTGDFLDGKLDEVRVWNIVRTREQIKAGMLSNVDASSAGLVGYWKLNESSGNTAIDAIGNNNGTLRNMNNDDWIKALNTYYVSNHGDDLNNGLSWENAKETIQNAIDESTNYEIILVKYGTYNISKAINVLNNRRITSDDGDGTSWEDAEPDYQMCTIDGSINTWSKVVWFRYESDTNYCKLRGFSITSQNNSDTRYGIKIESEAYPLIENCRVYSNPKYGILLKNNAIIRNNLVENNKHGIYLDNYSEGRIKLYNNTSRNNSYGIFCQYSIADIYNNTVLNNSVEGITIAPQDSLIRVYNNYLEDNRNSIYVRKVNVNIYNNVIKNSTNNGISVTQGDTKISNIFNNLIQASDNDGISVDASNANIFNNLIQASDDDGISIDASDANIYNNTIVENRVGVRVSNDYFYNILSNAYLTNNIIAFSTSESIWSSDHPGRRNSIYLKHNCFWQNARNCWRSGVNFVPKEDLNSSYDDPNFVGSGDHPHSLLNNSYCVNLGYEMPDAEIGSKDLKNSDRVYEGQIDLGAYEQQENKVYEIISTYPHDGSRLALSLLNNLSFKFNNSISAQGGNISLFSEEGTLIKQVASNDPNITINNNTVNLELNESLDMNKRYYAQISNTAFDFGNGINFTGINNDQDWDWITTPPDDFAGNNLQFDGVDDYIEIAHNDELNPDSFTIECWVRVEGGNNTYRSVITSRNKNSGITVYANDSNVWEFKVRSKSSGEHRIYGPEVVLNEWVHLAMAANIDYMKFYVNGRLVGKYSGNCYNRNMSEPMRIGAGRTEAGAKYFFNGKIDELRIWNTFRSQEEIRENMHKTLNQDETKLVAYFQMNQSAASSANDVFSGYNGTLMNMGTGTWNESPIAVGNGISSSHEIQDGFSGNVVFAGTNLSMNINSKTAVDTFTVTKILNKPVEMPSGVAKVFDEQYWVFSKYGEGSYSSEITFALEENITENNQAKPSLIKLFQRDKNSFGNWTMIAAASNCDAASNTVTFSNITQSGQFIIGKAAGTAEAKAGNALEFDGADDYVWGSGLFNEMEAFTIEAWVFNESLPAIIQRYISLSPETACIRHDGASQQGQLHFYIKKQDGSKLSVRANNALETGKWYHIAGVADGSGMKLYLNGKEVGSNTTGSLYANDGQYWISHPSETMDGLIDEVRIWNIKRTEDEIRKNMHKILNGDETGLVGYWQMNGANGSTKVTDIAGGNDGTLVNMNTNQVWSKSSVPTGGGSCQSCTAFSNGTVSLGNVSITTTDDFDNAVELVCTEITNSPNTNSGITGNALDRYFVLSAFGEPGTFSTNITFTLPDGKISSEDQATPSNLKLYRRESTSDGEWTMLASGTSATTNTVTFEGITSYSQFIIGSGTSPLPVELISFNASIENNNVILNWQTATEVNNYGFEIERQKSENGTQNSEWMKIGFVEGHGNSSSPKEYSFTDTTAYAIGSDTLKYRLKQIDTDGTYKYYSLIAEVNNSITSLEDPLANVPTEYGLSQNYPNPFNPETNIEFSIPYTSKVTLKIYDILGQRVGELVNKVEQAGYKHFIWKPENIASGIYFVRLSAIPTNSKKHTFTSVKKMTYLK